MSQSDVAIGVRGLSKSYTIEHNAERQTTLAEQLIQNARKGFKRAEKETFWALKELDFNIMAGDVVGVVGRNGAGKSTLLKVLSRITEPTHGEVDLYGSVGSLLEVGTGFHPELTGRENVYLNGAILGMPRKEIDRQFDAIVDFSGVEKFLDTPVKRYSSGMYVRLAFAVAAHLDTEILLVDEVLAVGDAEFQKKCLGKIKDVAHGGRTVLFVSHHMQSVQVLCTRAMYLEKGRLLCYGEVPQAIDYYVRSFERPSTQMGDPKTRPGSGELRVTSISTSKEFYECAGEKTIRFTIERFSTFTGKYFVSCHIVDHYGVTILQCDSRMVGHWIDASDRYEGEFTLRTPWLKPNTYRVDLFICSAGVIDSFEHACQMEILPLLPYPSAGNTEATSGGIVFADFAYQAVAKEESVDAVASK
jgi:lipopolysaccharide transport system ATP-binding protein